MTCCWPGRWSIEIDIFLGLIQVEWGVSKLNNAPVMLSCLTGANVRHRPREPDVESGPVRDVRPSPVLPSLIQFWSLRPPLSSRHFWPGGEWNVLTERSPTDHRGTAGPPVTASPDNLGLSHTSHCLPLTQYYPATSTSPVFLVENVKILFIIKESFVSTVEGRLS